MGHIQVRKSYHLLEGYRIFISVGGSISSYRTPDIIRDLRREGAEVHCILSPAAEKMIGAQALEWASGNVVIKELTGRMEHITFFENNDKRNVLLMCPATYNQIGKIANGIADGVAETFFSNAIGMDIPVVVVPAMHLEMFRNPVNSRNIDSLKQIGVKIVEPRIEDGKAKIMWSEEIIDTILQREETKKSILIISGTSELKIDPVRSLINRSSGLTGISLARAAKRDGFNRIVYLGNSNYRVPLYCQWIEAHDVDDFYSKTRELLAREEFDYIVIPAALSDFKYESRDKKIESKSNVTITLEPREKLIVHILEISKKWKKRPRIVRFKLGEDDFTPSNDSDYMTILNLVSDKPFQEVSNRYSIFRGKERIMNQIMNKIELADFIIREMQN
ncbi:bifunctional phosphopantothenoylcysteine decarboxylase/phosphopantothenate--cysteine ligase CoaBC [Cuniculiplasma sp. SKW4]|uniref:bifunctional phosphopantothenoylcysteine decarboxylase/phosphopantothenate--cysteine ligase CoaBC n=1 Tax=Cuniculiplasma sp. SKW4 TaxID=3400171 RepID=UPI003FD2A988